MTDKELKLGMVVCGQNNAFYDRGKIKTIELSTGSRKGLLYKVGINYFFSDEIDVDWACINEIVGNGNIYELKKPFGFKLNGKRKVATKVCFKDNFELLGNGFRAKIYELRQPTIRRLYWQIVEEKGI